MRNARCQRRRKKRWASPATFVIVRNGTNNGFFVLEMRDDGALSLYRKQLRWSMWASPALNEPGGCSSLHALTALVHFAALTLTPKEGKSPDALGSGKSLTPFARMHSGNFTPCPER